MLGLGRRADRGSMGPQPEDPGCGDHQGECRRPALLGEFFKFPNAPVEVVKLGLASLGPRRRRRSGWRGGTPPGPWPSCSHHLVWGILVAILLVCSVTIEHFFQLGIFINIAAACDLRRPARDRPVVLHRRRPHGPFDRERDGVRGHARRLAHRHARLAARPPAQHLADAPSSSSVSAPWSACSTRSWWSVSGSTPLS